MTLELLVYLLLVFMAIVSVFFNIPEKINATLYFFVVCIYSIAVRYSGFDIDMNTYARTLSFEDIYGIYYLREPVYWISSNYLYQNIIRSEELVFFTFDMVSFISLYLAHKNFKTPNYFLYAFIIFFPALMGFQNIYRQYLSMCFLLLSISYMYNGKKRKYLFWLLSGLTHNVGFIFLPILFLFSERRINRALFYASSLIIVLLLPLVAGSKSHDATGLDLGMLYVMLTFTILLIVVVIHLLYDKFEETSEFIIYESYLFIILVVNVALLGRTQAERIGMLSLSMSTWVLCNFLSNKISHPRILGFVFVILCTVPTFLFNSAFSMLLTSLGKK